MALTGLQGEILKFFAASRRERGESYVAGDVALNTLLAAPRRSRDIDYFHDTDEALVKTWRPDRDLLTSNGFALDILREASNFVQAELDALDFEGARPDARQLGQRWHAVLSSARDVITALPPQEVGKGVALRNGPSGCKTGLPSGRAPVLIRERTLFFPGERR